MHSHTVWLQQVSALKFQTVAQIHCASNEHNNIFQSINQSINLFVQMQNKHWTGHQGRMQPPLTGAHKNNVSKSNKRQYFAEKKILLTEKCSNPTFTTKLNNSRLKLEILAANTTLAGNLFQKFMTRLWNILASRIFSIQYMIFLYLTNILLHLCRTWPNLTEFGTRCPN